MLLACPNCDARYDVPDDAIPETGRDVQCSNCGNAWFQLPAESFADDLADVFDPDVTEADFVGHAGQHPPTETTRAPASVKTSAVVSRQSSEKTAEISAPPVATEEPDPIAERATTVEEKEDVPEAAEAPTGTDALKAALIGKTEPVQPAPPPPEPVRRELDDAVLAILRDEAEREASARKIEAQRSTHRRAEADTGLQSQPELSMPAPTPEMTAQQKRLAMLRGEDLDEPDPEPSRPMARRDLLPDVEEINSTLQPDEARYDPEAEVDSLPDLNRGSFRTGFLLAMLVLVIATLLYVFSNHIIAAVPALESIMQTYVVFIDNLRNWLNLLMDDATHALTGEPQTGG